MTNPRTNGRIPLPLSLSPFVPPLLLLGSSLAKTPRAIAPFVSPSPSFSGGTVSGAAAIAPTVTTPRGSVGATTPKAATQGAEQAIKDLQSEIESLNSRLEFANQVCLQNLCAIHIYVRTCFVSTYQIEVYLFYISINNRDI